MKRLIQTPIATDIYLEMTYSDQGIRQLQFQIGPDLHQSDKPAGQEWAEQIAHYLSCGDDSRLRELPIEMEGTDHQCRVWDALRQIPSGKVRNYGSLAQQLGSGAQAVAGACRSNRIVLLVPCHRVVARHSIGGFMGHSAGRELMIKKWLLDLESSTS